MLTLNNSNINILKFGVDKNGNKTIKIGFVNHKKTFTIQTNSNLPTLHNTDQLSWKYQNDYKNELYKYIYSLTDKQQHKYLSLIQDESPYVDTLARLETYMPKGVQIEAKNLLRGKVRNLNIWYSSELQTILNKAVANNLFANPRPNIVEYINFHTEHLYNSYITYFDKESKLIVYHCGNGDAKESMKRKIATAIKG